MRKIHLTDPVSGSRCGKQGVESVRDPKQVTCEDCRK